MRLKWKKHSFTNNDIETKDNFIKNEQYQLPFISGNNKIYFYDKIDSNSILTLHNQIDECSKQIKLIQFIYDLSIPIPIKIHICSDGGEIWPALSIADKIMNSEIPIYTYCEGLVASAATIISISGHKRFISKNSSMLIHQISSELWGNYDEFQDEIKNMELLMDIIRNIYLQKTKFTKEELDTILSHDLYLNSSQCLEKGLVDAISGPSPITVK